MTISNFYAMHTGTAPLYSETTESGEAVYQEVAVHSKLLGTLDVPSGKLAACDPAVCIKNTWFFEIPAGSYPVYVTLADVSEEQDQSDVRECYLSVRFSENESVKKMSSTLLENVPSVFTEADHELYSGIPVDAGVVAFFDKDAVQAAYEKSDDRLKSEIFDMMFNAPEADVGLFRPDQDKHSNLICSHSGWGDGSYPVIQTVDADGNVTGIHIDLLVIGEDNPEN